MFLKFVCFARRKGLSRHYEGKSRSFTSLGSVRSLEDVVKPEKAYSKKLKSCRRSYGGGLCSPINAMSRQICKKGWHSSSRSLCCSSSSSMSARRNSVNCMSSRPPIPPHRSTTMSNQTALFAWRVFQSPGSFILMYYTGFAWKFYGVN